MKIALGTIIIDDDTVKRCKAHGYSRRDIRDVIVGNGEESLMNALDTTLFCNKCGIVGVDGGSDSSCEHEWRQD